MLTSTILAICAFAVSPAFAQFLTPEDTVRIPPPADVPVAPISTPAAPTPAAVTPTPTPTPVVTATTQDGYFADFAAYPRAKGVILSWHLVQGRTMEKRIQIYRFNEEPRVIHDISKGTLIAKLTGEINIYEDVPPGRGTYYYAIFVETGRGLEPGSFNSSRNLVGPMTYQMGADVAINPGHATTATPHTHGRPDFESTEVNDENDLADEESRKQPSRHEDGERGINNVIRHTFLAGDFSGAAQKLKPFMRNRSAKVRAKAMFYTGMARYRLGQYERSLKYFDHPLTRKYYRRNVEFWINRTKENLR